ncbi:hypothetical protein CLAVI_000309 [Candidatus Clavichlamydia salmonicola]|uniref:hypothetical protein n=1 Tax=Candidatus Clavichlamydia salmonicola TaxID=469812 RepID=UPI0018916A79|nr:hypothetical protein [Candidatus Clavichlamydia salmonicola]MBF5050694.1 hypothetical protein [Candidatus Clavichlamydia salmonicola]
MVIFHNRAPSQQVSIEEPLSALTQASSLIKSWHSSIKPLFFNKGGIMVGQLRGLPILWVTHAPLNSRVHGWISIGVFDLTRVHTFDSWKRLTEANMRRLLQLVREYGEHKKVRICKQVVGSIKEIIELDGMHLIQLVASFLNLYKDVLKSYICLKEGNNLVALEQMLHNLPKTVGGKEFCNVLREMTLEVNKLSIYRKKTPDMGESQLDYLKKRLCWKHQFSHFSGSFMSRTSVFFLDLVWDWLISLSDEHFLNVYVDLCDSFLADALTTALCKRSTSLLISILKRDITRFAPIFPVELLQKALKEMLKNDFNEILKNLSIKKLLEILQNMSLDLLEKILLELPENIVSDLKLEIGYRSLDMKIQEYLVELNMAYQRRAIALKVNKTSILSLRSLAAIAIFKASNSSLVPQGVKSLSSTCLERILQTSPGIEEEVQQEVRIRANIPFVGTAAEFIIGEEQSKCYLPQLDLLPLASMLPGYKDVFKKTLLEKCGDNNKENDK